MASFLIVPETAIINDNSGTLMGVLNADTFASTLNNVKVQGLVNLGTHAFNGYPLTIGTDIPAANESRYVANDNSGNLVGVINADTSTAVINNAKLGGPLVSSVTGNNGITVTSPAGVGAATLGLSGLANGVLAGPLVSSIVGADGITVTNPGGVGAADLSLVNVPNGVLAGPLVASITAGTGISVSNPAGVGAATVSATNTGNVVAKATNTEITATTATTVLTYTPTATGQFAIKLGFSVITAETTVTITATWTDPASAAVQTYTWLSAFSAPVGTYELLPLDAIAASTASAVAVTVTAGTASQVWVTGRIEEQV